MRFGVFLLCIMAFAMSVPAQADSSQNNGVEEARLAAARAEAERRRQAGEFARLRAISERRTRANATLIADANGRFLRYNLSLTEADKQAIAVGDDIRQKYRDLLKRGKAGVVRLQNADICTPNKLVVAAAGGCPNNVVAKATAFSFRTGDYVAAMFSDVFFKGTALSSTGAYTIGIFANLGQADLTSLDTKTDGIRQLGEFKPPTDVEEFERQSAILRRGARIGDFVYLPNAEVKPGDVFVLRSVAYRANLFRGEKPRRVNVLTEDERADVTVAFKVETLLSDGSIVLVWRELKKSPPPDVVLEAAAPKVAKPNKFLSTITQ